MTARRRNFSTYKPQGTDDVVMLDFNQGTERAGSFPCNNRISGMSLVEFISQMDENDPRAIGGAVIAFLRASVKPTEWESFLAYVRDVENGVELDELVEVCTWLAEQYTGENPTQPSAQSSPGSSASGPGPWAQPSEAASTYAPLQPIV